MRTADKFPFFFSLAEKGFDVIYFRVGKTGESKMFEEQLGGGA